MRVRREVAELAAPDDGSGGQSAREPLRDADYVGLEAVAVRCEEASAASEAGLHLVGDEQRSVRAAGFRYCAAYFLLYRVDAALALHGLDEYGERRVCDFFGNFFWRVVLRRVYERGEGARGISG